MIDAGILAFRRAWNQAPLLTSQARTLHTYLYHIMKKTLIALMLMSGVAMATTNTKVVTSIDLDGTQPTDTRLDMAYNETPSLTINTTVDAVTIYGTDGYGLTTANTALTFNVLNTLTATNNIKLASTGASSTVDVVTTITEAELAAIDANGSASRWVVSADILNNIGAYVTNEHISLTLNGVTGYVDGGCIFDCNGTYYSAADVTFSGDYASVKNGAVAFDLADGTIYTTLKIAATGGASVKGVGFVATALIPEPATATLSLLALAGLAVRRRRR